MIALVFSYEVRDAEAFEVAYGADGDWAQFFRQARGYIGTELLRDVETPSRYLVVDRWETAEAYNVFAAERRGSTCVAWTTHASTTSRSFASGRSRRSGTTRPRDNALGPPRRSRL